MSQFFTECGNLNGQLIRSRIEVDPPYVVEQGIGGANRAGGVQQAFQEAVLLVAKLRRGVALAKRARRFIQGECSDAVGTGRFLRHEAVKRVQPGLQEDRQNGRLQVIVGAQLQRGDLREGVFRAECVERLAGDDFAQQTIGELCYVLLELM